MSQEEFEKTYFGVIRKWPATKYLFNEFLPNNIQIIKSEYVKDDKGQWHLMKHVSKMRNACHYMNILDGIPFFENMGGTENIMCTYTRKGYLPTIIQSVSPDQNEKLIWEVCF